MHRLGTLSDGGERDGGPPEAVDVLLSQLGSTGDQSNTVMIEENNDALPVINPDISLESDKEAHSEKEAGIPVDED